MAVNTIRHGTLEYLAADGIGAPHGFTTRLGGVSQGILSSLNLGMNRGDDPENIRENYRILTEALGIPTENLVLTRQTHSDIVRVVTKADAKGLDHRDYPECDAMITNDPGTALMIFTADCTPILFYDPVTGAVGAAHAGWRGTAAGIAEKAVKAMEENFGCKAENIRCAIGPNIAQCCFETDADVPTAMVEALGEDAKPLIRQAGEKYYVNLKEMNALFLRRAGVTHIDISPVCTACEHQRFWSHRVTKGDRGSQGAMIYCKEVTG